MRWLVSLGLLAGCYRPGADPACITRCDPAAAGEPGQCPGALVCAADGMCREADGSCGEDPMPDGGGPGDMRPDDSTPFCYGTGLLRVCLQALPTGTMNFATGTIDTTSQCTETVAQTGGPELCVIAAESVSMANMEIRGSRPLVVVGTASIALIGVIDVASRRVEGSPHAAGSNEASCAPINNPFQTAGGNGGSFGGMGGRGGRSGMASAATVDPSVLRGGCPGITGGSFAAGGRGGGAIYFIAGQSIAVGTATINASGAGGSIAMDSGGGGGGSGGMIGFDAPKIDVTMGGSVFANGGGGAGGENGTAAGAGGESPSYQLEGTGGASAGATGGEGSLVSLDGAAGVGVAANGGGGGSSAGVIVIYPLTQANAFGTAVSPPVTN